MSDSERLLRRLKAIAGEDDLRRLFAEIRRRSDEDLLASEPPGPSLPKAPRNDVATRVAATLSPILASASEKAEMLVDQLAVETGEAPVAVRGLAPTIRKLVARYGEEKIEAAADAIMARMRAWGSTRERVS